MNPASTTPRSLDATRWPLLASLALVSAMLGSGCVMAADEPIPDGKTQQPLTQPAAAAPAGMVDGKAPVLPTTVGTDVLLAPQQLLSSPPPNLGGGDDEGPRPNPWTPPPDETKTEKPESKNNQGADGDGRATPAK